MILELASHVDKRAFCLDIKKTHLSPRNPPPRRGRSTSARPLVLETVVTLFSLPGSHENTIVGTPPSISCPTKAWAATRFTYRRLPSTFQGMERNIPTTNQECVSSSLLAGLRRVIFDRSITRTFFTNETYSRRREEVRQVGWISPVREYTLRFGGVSGRTTAFQEEPFISIAESLLALCLQLPRLRPRPASRGFQWQSRGLDDPLGSADPLNVDSNRNKGGYSIYSIMGITRREPK